ncbi:MAG: OmpH family outer membrane protein [Sandaracinaceae bacterium]
MNVSRHAATLLAAVLLATVTPSVFAQVRIGVVDLQRALIETEDGRRAKRRLDRLLAKRQQELNKSQNSLKALKEEIESNFEIWNDATKQKKIQTYQESLLKLQQEFSEFQQEIAQQEARLTQGIIERMYRILRRIGQAEGYTIIVERNEGGVVFVPSNLDLTDVVIQRYNAGEGRDADGEGEGSGRSRGRRRSTKNRGGG